MQSNQTANLFVISIHAKAKHINKLLTSHILIIRCVPIKYFFFSFFLLLYIEAINLIIIATKTHLGGIWNETYYKRTGTIELIHQKNVTIGTKNWCDHLLCIHHVPFKHIFLMILTTIWKHMIDFYFIFWIDEKNGKKRENRCTLTFKQKRDLMRSSD